MKVASYRIPRAQQGHRPVSIRLQSSTERWSRSTIEQNLARCRELLKTDLGPLKSKRRKSPVKRIVLSSDEQNLFDSEDLLSAFQSIIANAHGRHLDQAEMKFLNRRSSIDDFDEHHFRFPLHRNCRGDFYPETDIARQKIRDDQIPWSVQFLDYHPPFYTDQSRKVKKTLSDPPFIPSDIQWNRFDQIYHVDRRTSTPDGFYQIDDQGYPLNPLGRTGLRGRGCLARWAVNHQIHLVLICTTNEMKRGMEKYRCLVKRSKRDSSFSLISSSVNGTDPDLINKQLNILLLDLYRHWNGKTPDRVHADQLEEIVDKLTFVSSAYLDDERNTDNAWIETSICCYLQRKSREIPSIDLNELFPSSSHRHSTIYRWYSVNRTSPIRRCERDILKLIAKHYQTFW